MRTITADEIKELEIERSSIYKEKGKDDFVLITINGDKEFEFGKYYLDKEEFEKSFSHPHMWGITKCFNIMKDANDKKYGLVVKESVKESEEENAWSGVST